MVYKDERLKYTAPPCVPGIHIPVLSWPSQRIILSQLSPKDPASDPFEADNGRIAGHRNMKKDLQATVHRGKMII